MGIIGAIVVALLVCPVVAMFKLVSSASSSRSPSVLSLNASSFPNAISHISLEGDGTAAGNHNTGSTVFIINSSNGGDASSTPLIKALGVQIAFTALFYCAMALVTRASRQELFGASAAYSAVLVVFVSSFGSNN